jgi:hypothetical protein
MEQQKWMRDRDLLVQETLAFAAKVAAESVRNETSARIESPKAPEFALVAKPRDEVIDREEMRQRVADFKTTQNRFQREREDYFNATMAKARSSRSES